MNLLIDSERESPRGSETKVVGIDIGGTEIKMAAFSAARKMNGRAPSVRPGVHSIQHLL
jgi:hypothetical protein